MGDKMSPLPVGRISQGSSSVAPQSLQSVHRFAVVTAVATFLLLVAGALVTSNDAGLSVPDWPLSHGSLMPDMVGGVFYEHTHRLIAATVAILTLILAIWISRVESRSRVRRLAWTAVAMVLAQALLGGLTVLFYLPVAISVLHACLAQLFFCAVVVIALVTSRAWRNCSLSRFRPGRNRKEAIFCAVATGAVYLQLILGALVRHTGTSEGSKGVTLVTHALLTHMAGAVLAGGLLLMAAIKVFKNPRLGEFTGGAYAIVFLVLLQFVLGFGALWARIVRMGATQPLPMGVLLTTSHLALGAILLAAALLLTLQLSFSSAGEASGNDRAVTAS